MRARLFGTGLGLLFALVGCTDSIETQTVSEVVGGVDAPPQDVVEGIPEDSILLRGTVTDVIPGDQLLVELTDTEETIWVSGFAEAPPRAASVFTALIGEPEEHDTVGLVYPSVGVLEEPETGISDSGALGVAVGAGAVVAGVIALVAGLFARVKPERPCPSCGVGVMGDWLTCAACGRKLTEMGGKAATMFVEGETSPAPEPASVGSEPAEPAADDGDDDSGGSAPTRIIGP